MTMIASETWSPPNRFADFAARFAESKVATAALVVLTAIVLAAAFLSPFIAPTNPYDLVTLDILDSRLPPGSKSMTGMTFWLGTDGQGRDLLSAILYGLAFEHSGWRPERSRRFRRRHDGRAGRRLYRWAH